ncbi:MAG: cytidine deaminase [Candidatus Peribacteria bacterium]|nr:cytidine deaminase [Candidatus Peribacteria bacterium]
MNITREVAQRSKDPSTQVGCVIVDQQNRPVSFGYNGRIAGSDESYFTYERPQKYYAVIHAEMNAILFAKKSLEGCKLYCTYACCENCLKFIIQAGIKEVIYEKAFLNSYTTQTKGSMQYPEAFEAATRLIKASEPLGFSIHNINGTPYLEELWGGAENIPDFRGK